MRVLTLALCTLSVSLASPAAAQYVALELVEGTGRAYGQNEEGQVVGYATRDFVTGHAFSWTPNGGVEDLGTLGGDNSDAFAVNEHGQVVGSSSTIGSQASHAFLWSPTDGMVDLGTLGGSHSHAMALNNLGQVVGSAEEFDGDTRPFSWTAAGGMMDLGTFGAPGGGATAVSDGGQVVGFSYTPQNWAHAFSWTYDTGLVDIGTFGGRSSFANDVNNAGQVVGSADTSSGERRAFLWTAAAGMLDLGTLGGAESDARAINNRGQVVGTSSLADGSSHAFLWTEQGGMVDLGTLGGAGSSANAVSEAGHVVGTSSEPGGLRGFVWHPSSGMVPLGTLGGDYGIPSAVNANGQVAGFSTVAPGFSPYAAHPTVWVTDEADAHVVLRPIAAVASSVVEVTLGPTAASDGNPFSRWSSDFSDNQWIEVDLGEATTFDRIHILWELARAATYDIQTSLDGRSWQTLRQVSAEGDRDDLIDLNGYARYVRMQGIRRATHWGYSLYEFEVWRRGDNIAIGRPMAASSVERHTFPASWAADRNLTTRWSSDFADEQWIAFDFGRTVSIESLSLRWETALASEYEVQVSDDNVGWTTVRGVSDGDGAVDELKNLAATGRYLRLLLHRRGSPWGFSLWEVEVLGKM